MQCLFSQSNAKNNLHIFSVFIRLCNFRRGGGRALLRRATAFDFLAFGERIKRCGRLRNEDEQKFSLFR